MQPRARGHARGACALAAAALLAACSALGGGSSGLHAAGAIDADRIERDVTWLADDAREGRGVGTRGNAAAAAYLADGFRAAGLEPAGDEGSFLQRFEMPVDISVAKASLSLGGVALERSREFDAFLSSGDGAVRGETVFAGYGISAPNLGYDDYHGLDVDGRIVLVLDDRPAGDASPLHGPETAELLQRANKVAMARARGAAALLIAPAGPSEEPAFLPGNAGRDWANPTQQASGLPVLALSWEAASRVVAAAGGDTLEGRKRAIDAVGKPASAALAGAELALEVAIERHRAPEANVVAILRGSDPQLAGEAVVIGAHYDHLGRGAFGSLAPDRRGEVHNGADDNASGAAGLLELARSFAAQPRPRRSLVLAAFSGEEVGLVGSAELVHRPPVPIAKTVAMVNLDMIGRLHDGALQVFGTDTSPEFPALVQRAADSVRIDVNLSSGAFAPSDQTTFLARGVPVLFFFTGNHSDYHTPDDDSHKIDANGEASVLAVVSHAVRELLDAETRPPLAQIEHPKPGAAGGPGYGPYLGTIPDFGSKPGEGVLIQGVRQGSPAETAGLRAGDRIVTFDGVPVANLEEYAARLFAARTGQRVKIAAVRDGKRLEFEAVLGQRH